MTEKEKKVEKVTGAKMVYLQLGNKIHPLSLDDRMPEDFLKTKFQEKQRYIPINVYREMIRQIWEFGIPQFEIEKFVSWNNKSNVAMIAYKCICKLDWFKYWDKKEPIVLIGNWYSAISAWALLSDAIHWNMHTLQAKALRDALKYSYRIFEFPEDDVSDPNEAGTIHWEGENPLSPKAEPTKTTVDDVVKDMPEEDSDIQKKIKEDYSIAIKELWEKAINESYEITKKDVLSIGTALKEKYWEDNKKFIISILMKDVEAAK